MFGPWIAQAAAISMDPLHARNLGEGPSPEENLGLDEAAAETLEDARERVKKREARILELARGEAPWEAAFAKGSPASAARPAPADAAGGPERPTLKRSNAQFFDSPEPSKKTKWPDADGYEEDDYDSDGFLKMSALRAQGYLWDVDSAGKELEPSAPSDSLERELAQALGSPAPAAAQLWDVDSQMHSSGPEDSPAPAAAPGSPIQEDAQGVEEDFPSDGSPRQDCGPLDDVAPWLRRVQSSKVAQAYHDGRLELLEMNLGEPRPSPYGSLYEFTWGELPRDVPKRWLWRSGYAYVLRGQGPLLGYWNVKLTKNSAQEFCDRLLARYPEQVAPHVDALRPKPRTKAEIREAFFALFVCYRPAVGDNGAEIPGPLAQWRAASPKA